MRSRRVEQVEDLNGASVGVLGAGRSGVAAARLFAGAGAKVLLSDSRSEKDVEISMQLDRNLHINFEFGGHSNALLATDLLCVSPGIPLNIPILQEAQEKSIPCVGEIEAAYWFCESPIVAITGSNGKSTTTTLIGQILNARYENVLVGGNLGTSFSELLMEMNAVDQSVVEVSSFQLESITTFRPEIGIVMNLSPNHLDRYPGYESYVDAKLRIWKNMKGEDILIYCADDALLSERVNECDARLLPFSTSAPLESGAWWQNDTIRINWENIQEEIPVVAPRLMGPHNRYNMIAAAAVGALNSVNSKDIANTLTTFPGLEHRLEFCDEIAGVKYYNDSKATTVSSLGYALQSFESQVVLIAGGVDKGGDFSELVPLLSQRVRSAMLIGEAANRIEKEWQGVVPLHRCESLDGAMIKARDQAESGDVVLLSPACSSFDMFDNFEARGNSFKTIVKKFVESR